MTRKNDDLLAPRELADETGVGPRTVYNWISRGVAEIKLPVRYVGAAVLISRSDYREWQRCVNAALGRTTAAS